MLRANVGLSRKVSRDYQSTGYSVNLDGEIPFTPDDPEAVLEKVRELFDLAQEALNREIDRDQSEAAIGRRDEETPATPDNDQGSNASNQSPPSTVYQSNRQTQQMQHGGQRTGNGDPATNKQVQFILTMGKRFKLSTPQLEARISQIVGHKCGVYDLTKTAGSRSDQPGKEEVSRSNITGGRRCTTGPTGATVR
jgi:hypothetical protein